MNSASDIRRHVGTATGKRGFLKWIEAVYPHQIAQAALQRATVIAPSSRASAGVAGFGVVDAYGRIVRVGRSAPLSGFGQATDSTSPDVFIQDVSFDPASAGAVPTVTADSTGADNSAASPSWVSSIGNAITAATAAAGQAYLTVTQTQAQQQILQTNLQRAAAGLPPLPYTAAQLGVQGPTVNVGLASGTLTPILLVGGGIALLALLAKGMGRRRA